MTQKAAATYCIGNFPGILFRDLSSLLEDEVEGSAVHVFHADVDLSIAEFRNSFLINLKLELHKSSEVPFLNGPFPAYS